jgi:hypothetical protein
LVNKQFSILPEHRAFFCPSTSSFGVSFIHAQVGMQMKDVAMLFDMEMFDNQVTPYIALSC